MKLTALIENKAPVELVCEHGLAVHIEYRNKNYLLDSGATDEFLKNADRLGMDLSKIDYSVLSHAHYDHSGGFGGFFKRNNKAKVYLRGEAKEKCYIKFGPLRKYIGIPEKILAHYSDRFEYIQDIQQIEEGVWLIPNKPEDSTEKGKKAHMYRKKASGLQPDDFLHEQSLVFETSEGLVILNSCCHYGVDHIVEEVKDAFPEQEVLAVVGGFHLMGFKGTSSMSNTADEIKALGQRLSDLGVKKIYTCHCTGDPAFKILKEMLGDRVQYFSTGNVIEL